MIYTRSWHTFNLSYNEHYIGVYEIVDIYIIPYWFGKDIFHIEINQN